MQNKIKIVLVDTNCFIRIFHSSAHPIFGQDIGRYKFLTLECLIKEYLTSNHLIDAYPWIAEEPRISELKGAKLILRSPNARLVNENRKDLRRYARSFLELYCRKQNIPIRTLSSKDIELLATTVTLKCAIATDEWPLRLVAEDLMNDQDEYPIELLNSLELLNILETNGLINAEQRRITVDAWIRRKENLHREWPQDYQRLFNEPPDELGR